MLTYLTVTFRSLIPECLQIRKIAWWHSLKFLPNFLYETIIFQQPQSSVTSLSLSDKSPSKSSWKLRYHVTVHKSHSLNKCLLITLYTVCWGRVWRGTYASCFNASLVQSSCFTQFNAYTIAPLTWYSTFDMIKVQFNKWNLDECTFLAEKELKPEWITEFRAMPF